MIHDFSSLQPAVRIDPVPSDCTRPPRAAANARSRVRVLSESVTNSPPTRLTCRDRSNAALTAPGASSIETWEADGWPSLSRSPRMRRLGLRRRTGHVVVRPLSRGSISDRLSVPLSRSTHRPYPRRVCDRVAPASTFLSLTVHNTSLHMHASRIPLVQRFLTVNHYRHSHKYGHESC